MTSLKILTAGPGVTLQDHGRDGYLRYGVTAAGVSPYPSAVTVQMVLNFLAGGAAVNVFARHHGVDLWVVDAGVAGDLSACQDTEHARFQGRKVRAGTGNMVVEAAMSRSEAEAAVRLGMALADEAANEGVDVLGAGEMGIGNTTSAAACLSVVAGMPGKLTAGRGPDGIRATVGGGCVPVFRGEALI